MYFVYGARLKKTRKLTKQTISKMEVRRFALSLVAGVYKLFSPLYKCRVKTLCNQRTSHFPARFDCHNVNISDNWPLDEIIWPYYLGLYSGVRKNIYIYTYLLMCRFKTISAHFMITLLVITLKNWLSPCLFVCIYCDIS